MSKKEKRENQQEEENMDTNENEGTNEKTDREKDKEKTNKVDKVVIYQTRGKKEKWTTDKKTKKKYTPSKPTTPKSDQDKRDAMKASEKILRQQVRALPINKDKEPKLPDDDVNITDSAELEIQADEALLTDMQDNTEPEPKSGKNERNQHKKEDRKDEKGSDRKKCCDLCSHTPSSDGIIYVVEHDGEHYSTRQNSIVTCIDSTGLAYCSS